MKILAVRQNWRLLFKTYLIIVGGLAAIAIALDLGFARLQDSGAGQSKPWVSGNLTMIEDYLADLPYETRAEAIRKLEQRLGFPIHVHPADDVIQAGTPGDTTQEVFDAEGNVVYFRNSAVLDAVIRIGPVSVPQSAENALAGLVPPLFYLSIFIFVGVWVWPLIRDLSVLTESAAEFATDYRHTTTALSRVTSLKELAASLDDMSARIRNLIQAQKELTGALSHEMRTPLTRIKFALAVIGDKAKISNELRSIDEDVRELDLLVTTMLDYARLDHPDMEINRQLTPLDAWLEQTVSKSRIECSDMSVEQHAPPDLVSMDPYLMELALSNLLGNACRYARKCVRVIMSIEQQRCSLRVEDDGQGIPEADRATVFKAFARLDDSRNRETGGYGLGLAIVARVAALHRGTASAGQSELGGACIVLEWPCLEPGRHRVRGSGRQSISASR